MRSIHPLRLRHLPHFQKREMGEDRLLIIYNIFIMTKKYRKERQLTPAWLDTLIGWLEVLAAIGTLVGAIYALVSLFKMFSG
jgi:hypothetical protein